MHVQAGVSKNVLFHHEGNLLQCGSHSMWEEIKLSRNYIAIQTVA